MELFERFGDDYFFYKEVCASKGIDRRVIVSAQVEREIKDALVQQGRGDEDTLMFALSLLKNELRQNIDNQKERWSIKLENKSTIKGFVLIFITTSLILYGEPVYTLASLQEITGLIINESKDLNLIYSHFLSVLRLFKKRVKGIKESEVLMLLQIVWLKLYDASKNISIKDISKRINESEAFVKFLCIGKESKELSTNVHKDFLEYISHQFDGDIHKSIKEYVKNAPNGYLLLHRNKGVRRLPRNEKEISQEYKTFIKNIIDEKIAYDTKSLIDLLISKSKECFKNVSPLK